MLVCGCGHVSASVGVRLTDQPVKGAMQTLVFLKAC